MTKINKLLTFMVLFVGCLSLLEIILCNKLPDEGKKIKQIEKEIKSLEQENQRLNGEVAKAGSLLKIQAKAESQGFKNPQVVYLKQDAEFAFEP